MIHRLKIEDEYLKNLRTGIKKFEIRYNDRDYQKDDTLIFTEFGKEYMFTVTHIHSGLGLKEGYIVMSVSRIGDDE